MTQHHILIGPPSSGKTTLAQTLQHHLPPSVVISTDAIRAQLYGDPSIQGQWPEIFAQVQAQCHQAITAGKTLIYDATNAKRPWRFRFLLPFLDTYPDQVWIGWYLTTPLNTCLQWNQERHDRPVPAAILQDLHAALHAFPPEAAEGFATLEPLDPSQIADLDRHLHDTLPRLARKITNRRNATQTTKHVFHPYSSLLAFERLLYLIRVFLEYPGAGNLRHHQPDVLQQALGATTDLSTLKTDLDELSALLSQQDPLYGDRPALAQNLDWLQRNGFLHCEPCLPPWDLPEQPLPLTPTHGYSEIDRFLRLMGTLRFIAHHPFYGGDGSALEALTQALRDRSILAGSLGSCRNTLRKDIELILKPYGLLMPQRYKQGYFLGTGIFSQPQLLQLHQLLAGQAKSLADPTVLDLLNTLNDRLKYSKLSPLAPYPVRALYNFTITNQTHLPSDALANTVDRLEQDI
ncbi:ATP-binding protein, partial [Prochlorothrix hollandica]|uniref:ATP-binding protein n=1 Tax=Prochlorothrix hollandica TaxID=1223 RepID=UPI003342174C